MPHTLKWAVALILLLTPALLPAAVEHEFLFQAEIGDPIVDLATHPSEELVFLLTPKAVVIFSSAEQTVLDRIPLDRSFDRIAFHGEDRLLLGGGSPSRISLIRFSRIHEIDLSGRASRGPEAARVTLVVFDDYQCPYCARLEGLIRQVQEQFPKDVRYVVKHFPIANHPFAFPGAMAALAAGRQGKFWEYHSRLLEHHDGLSEAKLVEFANALGLDMDRFQADRQAEQSRQLILEDMDNGRRVGVRGTPTLFLNGKRINNRDLGRLPELIQRELGR